ncbi:hypothetical protein ACL02O_23725 [Micromonospora sp. MS34]|uniref:hypothetical protein n=1 Tax=Micromonospora sp. MS34 TaxID=3385971 RepID=UPI0039A35803
MSLLKGLDGLGLTGELSAARVLLARVGEVVSAEHAAGARVRAERDRLVADLVDGRTTLEAAAGRFPEPGSTAVVVDAAVRELRRRAVDAAQADVLAVHDVLADRAKPAVDAAVAAGRHLVDVPAVVKVLKPPKRPARGSGAPQEHPWVYNPPRLPELSVESIQADPVAMGHWVVATRATEQVRELLRVAGLLHELGGWSVRLFGGDVDRDVAYFVGQLPEQVHLAVADGLGWKPGVHVDLRPVPVRPARRDVLWMPPRAPRIGP